MKRKVRKKARWDLQWSPGLPGEVEAVSGKMGENETNQNVKTILAK